MLEHEVHVWRGAPFDRPASRRALRRVLARYLSANPQEIELESGEHGKPRLADPAVPLRFNLSHSGGAILIAIAREREVGVDIERIRPRRNLLRLAERALEPAEAAAVRAAPPAERPAAFNAAWARREAVAKCGSAGLSAPLPVGPIAMSDLDAGPGFAAALAVAAESMPSVKLFSIPPEHRR